jgi:hypothetical protein
MKKVVFAIQVFSLMTFLPFYVIVELNHGTGRLQAKTSFADFREKKEKTNIHLSLIDVNTRLPLLMPE